MIKSETFKHFIFCYWFWLIDRLKTVPAFKGPKPALDFRKAGLEGLPRPGNTETHTSVSVSVMLQESACVLSTSAPPLHCSTHRKDIKLKFIFQIE